MAHIFDPLSIRGITLQNRIVVSPMCQYSSQDGFANDWHLVHLGSRAIGGAGLVFAEASAVTAEGRITAEDLGIYKDAHVEFLSRIVRFLKSQGTVPGMQIAHAGRKASTQRPWEGYQQSFGRRWRLGAGGAKRGRFLGNLPHAPRPDERGDSRHRGRIRAGRAPRARKRAIWSWRFMPRTAIWPTNSFPRSAISGQTSTADRSKTGPGSGAKSFPRSARYGRKIFLFSFESRPRIGRKAAGTWTNPWNLRSSSSLLGVDLVDCSSAGLAVDQKIVAGPGFQVPFAERIRRDANIPTATVGLIETKEQVADILAKNQADLVFMAREFLRDPYWPLRAARELKQKISWPAQYLRAAPPDSPARKPLESEASKATGMD